MSDSLSVFPACQDDYPAVDAAEVTVLPEVQGPPESVIPPAAYRELEDAYAAYTLSLSGILAAAGRVRAAVEGGTAP